jgi:hypothetical protein
MTDPRAATIIDEIINLWQAGGRPFPCYGITDQALEYICEARAEHGIAISMSIMHELRKRGKVKP